MNIALLSEKYTPDIGGLAISTERLARLLTSAGHTVRVFCPSPGMPPSETRLISSNGVSITRFGPHKRADDTLVDWFDLIVREHQREPFDVIQGYFLAQAGFIAAYAGNYLNVASVVSIRGNDIERAAFDPSRFSHVMYALQHAAAVTTNASELMKKARAFHEREILLIPNGVDTDHFRPMPRNQALLRSVGLQIDRNQSEQTGRLSRAVDSSVLPLPQRNTSPVIGPAGELREKKGLKTLLSAFAHVNKIQPVSLMIIGTIRQGEDKQIFEDFRNSNPELRIIVTGYISPADLPVYYSLLDVFVHPSLHDGMPNAVLEAMACERAVIATPVGGVLDILEDGKNGMLAPVNDADRLAEKILELLDDPALRADLGRTARQTVIHRFPLAQELEANLALYKRLGLEP